MKKKCTRITSLLCVALLPLVAAAQSSFFTDAPEAAVQKAGQKRVTIPGSYRTLAVDTASLLNFLRMLPTEQAANTNRNSTPVILLPMPDGSTAQFHIWESSVMAPELAASSPTILTFAGQGITDATATLKLDFTELGFHAQILSPVSGAVYIDPYAQGALTACISYYKKDFQKKETFIEGAPISVPGSSNRSNAVQSEQCVGSNLRTYRLAVACTGEYAKAATGQASPTKAQTRSAIVTTVNRVNGIYENDLSLRIVLVAKEDSVIYTDPNTDPFTGNNDPGILLGESQTVIDNRIGNANYDMGHTFSTGAGGVSYLGVICQSGYKARSVTGLSMPVGDGFDVDFVAHEMGHSLGANHTFNSVNGYCGGNGVSGNNTEPGSGTTIMAYAGICSSDDLQPHSDPQFQAASLDEISTYIFLSNGSTCGTLTITGNTPPVVNAGANYIIPKSTPFILTGSATDANNDALTYCWEEIDKGGPFGAWNAPSGNAPLFRSFTPVTTPVRYFPKISDVINNTTTIGEILPSYARTIRFRLTARDNRAGGGGVCFDSTSIVVNGTAAPFAVTYPTATGVVWYINDFKTVTWNASTTAAAPISCANVTIQLSTDGGLTWPITLLASTPNDGSQEIQVPNNASGSCRVRVLALGNIFYDISNSNFTIQAAPGAGFVFNRPDTINACATGTGTITTTLRTGSQNGFTTPINLFTNNTPGGVTVTYSTNPIVPGSSAEVTISGLNSLTPGIYSVVVGGMAGSVVQYASISFITGAPLAPPSLTAPAAYAIGVGLQPAFSWPAVGGATSYVVEIATVADFSGTVLTNTTATNSYTPTTPLATNTTYFWRVKTINSCGTSAPGGTQVFRTVLVACNTFNSSIVPLPIPDIGTTTSYLVIPAASGVTISDVNVVGLAGNHPSTADLTFSLRSPASTNLTLLDRICSDGNLYQNFNINLDDQATATVPCNYNSGTTVKPQNPLAIFNGQSSAGTWYLTVTDNVTPNGGSLSTWGLQICSTTATPITYTFTGNGSWSNAANWSSRAVPPAVLPANTEIIIDPASGQCVLDVTQRISTGAKLTVKSGKMITVPGAVIIQ